ncbi:TonB-dependent receptor family protein [Aquimarina intermedia]|uniref:Iron complex outermembrane receptor protein n=1 Tax=Aquimarina intermedia TaxID=350814 RepID=A0A5S5C2X3_9FLAO|nr:TonB-dependent receptor [Aquimarina intermedia]TYP72832.1 iron complex outermembrane receptor protein [Aquimarina intermedia]
MKALLLSLIIVSFTAHLSAQERTNKVSTDRNASDSVQVIESEVIPLDEVTLTGLSLTTKLTEISQSVSIIGKNKLALERPITLSPLINQVPGVFMQSGTLNTNRITIRGIGARSLFGTANIRAYFGEIPLTDGNGESVIEDLELASVSQIEIYKGPAASNFGVGLGGTMILQPLYHNNATPEVTFTKQLGSYNFKKVVGTAGFSKKGQSINLIYSSNHSDGYRENNAYNRNTFTGVMKFDLSNKDEFVVLASYIHLNAQIPSSLTQEDFDATPKKAAFTWGASKAFEHVNQGLLGLTWTHDYSDNLLQSTSIFTSAKDNKEPRPFNILEEQTHGLGLRTKLQGNNQLLNLAVKWMVGVEGFTDSYNAQTFENTYGDTPKGSGSSYGEQLSDLEERRSYINLFAETTWDLTSKLKFNTGVHANYTFYTLDNRLTSTTINQLGDYNFDLILSPKFGLIHTFTKNLNIYGTVAHGFSMPTTAETILPDGTRNRNLQPEIGWNFEIGTRFSSFNNKLNGSLALYTMSIDDLLVSRRTQQDNFFAINAGKTRHSGIEAQLSYPIFTHKETRITAYANATLNNHRFRTFIDKEQDFSGNELTGVPSEVLNAGLNLVTRNSFYGMLSMQYVGDIPVNDGNTVYTDNYTLLNAQLGYKNKMLKRLHYDLFLNVNNITDSKYAAQVQVNAIGFGNNAPRYFYPGIPFNYSAGINIKYSL